ncbi:MAG TPA: glycosyltransferase family 39 protein, partial [Anaerolineae bacterium]|nr:glycosyltransferase family 39 protein [Anaerolineae bacterium]
DGKLPRSRSPQRLIAAAISVLMFAAVVLQLLALRTERSDPFAVLFDRSVDVAANGYFTVGTRITDVNNFLRNYPALMPTFPIHPQVHPPGVPLLYWATASVLETSPSLARSIGLWLRSMECNNIDLMLLSDPQLGSALIGMFLPLLANMLTIWCVYKLARRRFGQRAGLYAAAFWVIVPSAVLFAGNWSQVYPCLACLTWLSVDRGLAQRKVRWFLLAGLVMSIAAFMELGTAALGISLICYILADYLSHRRNLLRDWKFLGAALITSLVGVFSIWIVYQAIEGVSLIQIVQTMLPIHTGYEFDRLTWIFNHPYEFSSFLGIGFAGLLIFISIRSIRQAKNGQPDPLTLSLGLSLIVLTLIDPARDETARTWMIFMPLAIVVISQLMAEPTGDAKRFGVVWTLVALQLLVMIATLQVIQVGLSGPPSTRSTLSSIPSNISSVQVNFGDMVDLIGYRIDRPAPDQLSLDLYWKTVGPIDQPYVVFNHVLNQQGKIIAQQDSRPQNGQPLMTCWQPGEIFLDQHIIPIDPQAASGKVNLELGLYDAVTGIRVSVEFNGITSDHLNLDVAQHN